MSDQVDNKNGAGLHETGEQDHKTCQEQVAQLRERYLYLQAEFDNYKKRIDRERAQWQASAQADVFIDVLTIVDHFERALHQLKTQPLPAEAQVHLQGFELITKELYKVLEKYQIEEITEITVFDPETHEAVMQVQSTEHASGTIIEIFEKGYKHKTGVLRPAKVSVAQ